jgi:hypothetical protein
MESRIHPRRLQLFRTAGRFAAVSVVLALVAAGCGDDKGPTSPGGGGGGGGGNTTSFAGTLAGAGVSGALAITVHTTSLAPRVAPEARARSAQARSALNAAALSNVTGTIAFSTGGSVTFSGSYDGATDSIHFTATDSLGGVYEFHGKLDSGSTLTVIFGNWTGPVGAGGWGAFQGVTTDVRAYCGSFVGGSNSGSVTGAVTFLTRDVVIDGFVNARIVGVLWFAAGRAYPFKGWVVEDTDPVQWTLEIDGVVDGVYEIYFGGSLNRQTAAFTGTGGVEDIASPQYSTYGEINGGACQ